MEKSFPMKSKNNFDKIPNQSLNTIHRYVILFLIRAPAKGATTTIQKLSRCIRHFNPRSREGSDKSLAIIC